MINSNHFHLEKYTSTYWSMISILLLYTSISTFLEIFCTAAEKKKLFYFQTFAERENWLIDI